MLTLAIDTSTPLGGLCLYGKGRGIIAELRLGSQKTHSEKILTAVDFLIETSNLRIDDIDFITIGIGPGSFTGLRVGLSTTKGLAFATGCKVVAVSTLEAFALSLTPTEHLICPVLDARKKEVYAAVFRYREGSLERLMDDSVLDIQRLLASISMILSKDQDRAVFAGSGAYLYEEAIRNHLGSNAEIAERHHLSLLPSALAICGIKRAEQGEFNDPLSLVPVYLRKSEAELNTQIRYKD